MPSTALDDAGLVPGDGTEANDETIVAGNVISSDPAADAEVAPGSAVGYVRLARSRARWPCPTSSTCPRPMPSPRSTTPAWCPATCTEANDETIVAGNVISSDPAADAEVAPGSAVDLRPSRSVPRSVAVPDIVDLPEADALDRARRRRPGAR